MDETVVGHRTFKVLFGLIRQKKLKLTFLIQRCFTVVVIVYICGIQACLLGFEPSSTAAVTLSTYDR